MSIGKGVINTFHNIIDHSTWLVMKSLNIAKQTKRGCRAGRNKARAIKTRITNRVNHHDYISEDALSSNKSATTKSATHVNRNNLINLRKISSRAPCARYAIWNARSMRKRAKSATIIDFVISNQLDILAITETWLTGDDRDNHLLSDLRNALPDHCFHHVPRGKRGGGVGILLRRGFDVVVNDTVSYQSFEITDVTISNGPSSIRLFTIYRPPPSKKNKLTANLFFDEFSSLVEMITPLTTPFVIAGDFNFHMDVLDDREAMAMRDLLDSCFLKQHVEQPTHRKGHMLDLIITRESDHVVSAVKVDHWQALPSDYSALRCVLNISRPKATIVQELWPDIFDEPIIGS
jgi:exonuclease III